ncbi:unnamed protein product [Symbiodinium sp. CCMP2592]|nr:unnamed protein product [Symbiodinium sp. CCMP2592]
MDDDDEWCLPVASAVSQPPVASAVSQPPSLPRGNSAAALESPCEKGCLTQEEFCRLKLKWEGKLFIDPSQTSLGTWLSGRTQNGRFLVFCSVCARLKDSKDGRSRSTAWATGFQPTVRSFHLTHVQRHSSTCKVHKQAVKDYLKALGLQSEGPEDESCFLNREQFHAAVQKTWDGCRKGHSFRSLADDDVGSKSRAGRLVEVMGCACLAEEQEFLRDSDVLALYQDVRAGMLCIRYSAVSLDSQLCRHGVLGICHNAGTKSLDLVEAMDKVIGSFCTLDCDSGDMDHELRQHICEHAEFLQADGASDEQLTMRFAEQDLLTNVRLLDRDPTHAARRLLRNAWRADPYLESVLDQYITSPESMTALIQYSADLKHLFEVAVLSDDNAPFSVRNLGWAAHRFDSMTRPLSRFIVLFDSIWACGIDVWNKRKGTRPGERAHSFLSESSAESLLQLAMLADGSAETLDLVRFFDRETFDSASVAETLTQFKHRLDTLFVQREVLQCPGHTTHIIALLRAKEKTAVLKHGVLKVLGGPDSIPLDLIDRCIARMCNWVKLVYARIAAEFPNHDLVNSMSVFNLGDSLEAAEQTGNYADTMKKARQESLLRLSQAFGVAVDGPNQQELFRQYMNLRRNALHLLRTGKAASNAEAWRLARSKLKDKRLSHHPTHLIDVVLCRYQCLNGFTTSGVEQSFSTFVRTLGDYRMHMQPSLQEHLLRVVLAAESCMSKGFKAICEQIWTLRFHEFRKPIKDRFRREPSASSNAKTETSWQNQRRSALRAAAASSSVRAEEDVLQDAAGVGRHFWQPGHNEEMKVLENLAKDARLEAYARNHLLQTEIGDDGEALCQDLQARQSKRKKQEDEHRRAFEKMRRLAKRPAMVVDASVYLHLGNAQHALDDMASAMTRQNFTLSEESEVLSSDYHVVARLDAAPVQARLAAALCGTALCNMMYITSSGKDGTCIANKRALSTQRRIWISEPFLLEKPAEADLLLQAISINGSNWRVVPEQTWLHHALNGGPMKFLALVSTEEKESDYKDIRNAMTFDSFLSWIGDIDAVRCAHGAANR